MLDCLICFYIWIFSDYFSDLNKKNEEDVANNQHLSAAHSSMAPCCSGVRCGICCLPRVCQIYIKKGLRTAYRRVLPSAAGATCSSAGRCRQPRTCTASHVSVVKNKQIYIYIVSFHAPNSFSHIGSSISNPSKSYA